MKISIKGFIETSMLDWEGKIVSTLYVPYCNFRCPYCQNSGLVLNPDEYETIPFEVIEEHLVKHKGWIDGICLTGGEPCLYEDLIDFIKKIRCIGMQVKLDTNGTFPEVLKEIFDMDIINYLAMDIKGALEPESYNNSVGTKNETLLQKVKESIKIIMDSKIDYEFRTTVVPTLHAKEDIERIAQYIKGAKKYALQNFKPQETLDPDYMKIQPYNSEEIKKICDCVSNYVGNCVIRGI